MPALLRGNYVPALIGLPAWILVWSHDSVELKPERLEREGEGAV